ncbi:CBN-SRBC-45 protein [Caenorhabditis brenneri]|uniref:CBN-SRBC-45 protein n=1 Tax=Caenorhabditis brenneri TaxID=135651 RepID=G0NBN5_CAEBE|nr:CBN-SRBC-45 protein [Caenorhabditis brenneri]
MPDVSIAYWIFSAIAIYMMGMMVAMNFFILYKHTMEVKTWKKIEYQLILLRVTIDAFNGLSGGSYLIITVINLFCDFAPYNVTVMFGLVGFNLMEIRSFLAAIIAIERVLATTIPLKFYRYRSRVSNSPIVIFILSTGVACNVVLFKVCGYRFEIVPGCTNFNCATPICFQRYSSITRMVYSTTNVCFSVVLCYKLFWLGKQTKVSPDIRKANWLSLTDGLTSFWLELLPWVCSYYGIIDTKPLGPIIGALRTTGRVIETFVMLKLMRKDVVTVQPPTFSLTTRNNLK